VFWTLIYQIDEHLTRNRSRVTSVARLRTMFSGGVL